MAFSRPHTERLLSSTQPASTRRQPARDLGAMAVDQAGPEFQRALAAQRHEWEQQHASEMLSLAQEWTRRWSERERTWAFAVVVSAIMELGFLPSFRSPSTTLVGSLS